jgi:hypothetical protein
MSDSTEMHTVPHSVYGMKRIWMDVMLLCEHRKFLGIFFALPVDW